MLSEAARVHIETIRKFERGTTDKLRRETEDALLNALLPHVEFNGTRGVALRDNTYRLIDGPDCYLRLLGEILLAMQGTNNREALFMCVDNSVSTPPITDAGQRLRDAGIRCRYTTSEQATKFDFPLRDYRCVPARFYTNSVMVVYGPHVAILRGTNESVLVIHDADLARMITGQFEINWLNLKMPQNPP